MKTSEERRQAQRDAWGSEPRHLLERFIDHARLAAWAHGYAIAVHGSLARDIDLIAVPWVANASDPLVLTKAIAAAISDVDGLTAHVAGAIKQDTGELELTPAIRPHGRLSWVIGLQSDFESTQGHPYIDLSVMSPRA